MNSKKNILLDTAYLLFEDENIVLKNLNSILDKNFEIVCQMVMNCKGRYNSESIKHDYEKNQ